MSLLPLDRSEAAAIHAAIDNFSTHTLFRWTLASTTEAVPKHINVYVPMAGRILAQPVAPALATLHPRASRSEAPAPRWRGLVR